MLPLNQIVQGDCLEVMKEIPSESIDCIITDPPYGYSFMGKDWDKAVPSVETWRECLRVLKGGAFMFVMSAPRQDVLSQMIVRLGQAGFETGFTSIYWTYASGFPKAMNISLAVDKQECKKQLIKKLGREPTKEEFDEAWKTFRKVVGKLNRNDRELDNVEAGFFKQDEFGGRRKTQLNITKPASEEAKLLDGSYGGFQPKPAVEVIIVCMKPLSEKTYVEQALKNGKGVMWLDDCRIPLQTGEDISVEREEEKELDTNKQGWGFKAVSRDNRGRFPANLLVSDDVLNDGRNHKSGHMDSIAKGDPTNQNVYGKMYERKVYSEGDSGSFSRYFDLDKWFLKTVENLPENVKKTFPFLICPKASKSERNKGCESLPEVTKSNLPLRDGTGEYVENTMGDGSKSTRNTKTKNFHPTVKPLKLMTYLVTLGSCEGDVVLDPFVGSGTSCVVAKKLGRKFIGIEINLAYVEIARRRLEAVPPRLDTFL